jgi:hypothetical protein
LSEGEFVAIATGLERGVLSQLQGDHDLAGFWELDADDFTVTELMAAARSAVALPTTDTGEVVPIVHGTQAHGRPARPRRSV